MRTFQKTYIGDGAYIEGDGYHVVLTTENGISVQNRVCLDEDVLQMMLKVLIREGIVKEKAKLSLNN